MTADERHVACWSLPVTAQADAGTLTGPDTASRHATGPHTTGPRTTGPRTAGPRTAGIDRAALDATVRALVELGFEFGPPEPAVRSSLDTFDARLAAARTRLAARPVYVPGNPDAVELCPRGPGLPDRPLVVARLPRRADDLPAGSFRRQLGALTGDRTVLIRFTVRSACAHASLRDADGTALARIELHTGIEVTDGAGEPRSLGATDWCVELHRLDVAPGTADDAARRLRHRLHERRRELGLESRPSDAAAWAAHRVGIATEPRPDRTRLSRRTSAGRAVRDVLHQSGDTIDALWPSVLADDDPEVLHELRTVLRRARAVLWAAGDVMPEPARRDALDLAGALADRTGPARDLDVQLAAWDDRLDALDADRRAALEPVRALLLRRRQLARDELVESLGEIGRAAWTSRWHALVEIRRDDDGRRPRHRRRRAGRVMARRIARAHRHLVRDGRALATRLGIDAATLDHTTAEQLHRLRKDAKRLRYVVESFGSLTRGRHRRRYVRALKALLDRLGAHQDAVVHRHQLTDLVHELADAPPATCAALADLASEADDEVIRLRRTFADAFERVDGRATRRALRAVLDDLRA